MEHPPSSTDLAPNNLWLFPNIKSALKGRRFQDSEDIQKRLLMALISVLQEEFQKCFQGWQATLLG
jgi:hypothetical protein